MRDRVEIKEETRTYEIPVEVDANDLADALRDIADVIDNSQMIPSTITSTTRNGVLTIKLTLKRTF